MRAAFLAVVLCANVCVGPVCSETFQSLNTKTMVNQWKPPAAVNGKVCSAKVEPDIDYHGTDLVKGRHKNTLAECCEECLSLQGCEAWVFSPSRAAKPGARNCWVKKAGFKRVFHKDRISNRIKTVATVDVALTPPALTPPALTTPALNVSALNLSHIPAADLPAVLEKPKMPIDCTDPNCPSDESGEPDSKPPIADRMLYAAGAIAALAVVGLLMALLEHEISGPLSTFPWTGPPSTVNAHLVE